MPKDQIKQSKIVLKEGCKYRVKILFYVQRDIVAGLRYEQKVYRKGVRGTVQVVSTASALILTSVCFVTCTFQKCSYIASFIISFNVYICLFLFVSSLSLQNVQLLSVLF